MQLEPDSRRLDSLRSAKSERSGSWWVGVIAVGILVGNMLSYGAYELYQRWQLKQFMVTVDAMLEKQHQRSMETRERMAREHQTIRRAIEKERAVNAQLQQTCIFWRQQVQQENTEQNRRYRDTACARLNGLFR